MSNYNSDSTPDEEYNYNNNNINGENVSYASTNSELLPSTSADTSSEIQRPKSLTREEIEDVKKGEPIIGLKLTITPSFLDLCNKIASETDDSFVSVDRLKPATFSALSITIGSWTKIARHTGALIAKCYFKKRRQLAWEVLNVSLNNKIEFSWSNIAAIKATFHPNEGVLDIMLEKPPLFFQEATPEPGKPIKWEQCGDFTEQQQASIIRYISIRTSVLLPRFL
ncbi:uncharacterized protein LOC104890408 [Beta vulgaris subsp. vulgaris]|uniref:uncharacterized protein LOC104890408 n=1 Tax=Beta vulgaris subsp. vulgaris TaxID=3555 RepID=UPI0025473474|nr:uncharacterized protein LOC104890408 [Beta vulgaris subsp. vulgaris]